MIVHELRTKNWNIEAVTGYKPKTTFYTDFSIADAFGVNAIRSTYITAFESWKSDVIYLTELVMVLNWKIFEHFGTNKPFAQLYQDLYMEASEWALHNLKGEELSYYLETVD